MKLLCISNGHGEDAIALRILQQLQALPNSPEISVLPIVGEGKAYSHLPNVSIIGPVQQMPSGGFIYMDWQQLQKDVKAGLLKLTIAQFQAVRHWAKSGGFILAVGDIVPLLFAWLSGANYAFVGTAKSEYYLRDEAGFLPRLTKFERFEGWSGSVYVPWERWLMNRKRCKAVFPRDSLTTETLQKFGITAIDAGNPMMDDLDISNINYKLTDFNTDFTEKQRGLVVTLIPGSRIPEAYNNWQQILRAVDSLMKVYQNKDNNQDNARSLHFLGAIAPSLSLDRLQHQLEIYGWKRKDNQEDIKKTPKINDINAWYFTQKNSALILSQNAFSECLHKGDLAIAMAGTATEQFIGLGKPAIAIPGNGPQFTPAFAEAQSRLLGPSLVLVNQPTEVGNVIKRLFKDPDWLHLIAENGKLRMGNPGASRRIAEYLIEIFPRY